MKRNVMRRRNWDVERLGVGEDGCESIQGGG